MEQLLIIIIVIGLFFICRELMCWYWKINENLDNQRKIIEKLEKLDKLDDIERFLKYIDQNTMKKDNDSSKS